MDPLADFHRDLDVMFAINFVEQCRVQIATHISKLPLESGFADGFRKFLKLLASSFS